MKKLLIIFICVITIQLLSTNSNALELTQKGIKIGWNISSVSNRFDDIKGVERKYINGISGGGFIIFQLTNKLGFRTELLYSAKGGRHEGLGETTTYKMNFLETPILIQYNLFLNQKNFYPSFFLGTQLSFFLNGKYIHTVNSIDSKTKIESDDIRSPDIGLIFGAGVSWKKLLIFNIQYSYGLRVINDEKLDDGTSMNLKQQSINISVLFPF